MDIDFLRSVYTVLAFLTFLGIVLWAYSGARRARFDEARMLPFDDDDGVAGGRGR